MQTHMAIPCCPTRGSVSTWAPENALNRELDQSRVVIPVSLLIRWVRDHRKASVLNVCVSQRYSQYPRKLGINTLNYGEGPRKLGKSLGVSVDEAKALTEKYFAPYPMVREFITNTHRQIRKQYFVETIAGRPRRFPMMEELGCLHRDEMSGHERGLVAQFERQSVNAIIQGSAADVAKMAMIKCEFDKKLRSMGVDMLLQIHDELIFEVPEDVVDAAVPIIKKHMEHPFDKDLSVPLEVDLGVGLSWAAAKG